MADADTSMPVDAATAAPTSPATSNDVTAPAVESDASSAAEFAPNHTLYVNNLPERIRKEGTYRSLFPYHIPHTRLLPCADGIALCSVV
jgi:RNA recognition motif-containing protein